MLALHDLTGTSPRMDGNRFRDIMHGIFGMTDEGLMEAMYQVFDMDQDGCVGPEEFVVGMSVFLRGSLDEKIDYCFSVYDHNGDGMVSRDEMFHQLKSAVVNLPPGEELDEVVKDMVDLVCRKLDMDHDGRVSFNDYATAVHAEPLLLEVFGPVLPDIQEREAFLNTFLEKYGLRSQQL
ncbi:EF-hand calcium-binding domain-containing protein 1-like isoform X3 [Homarus americanus]|uniref:EF-hand calcium-binding domain-containing protein 1-like n=2 Tax=Homarus americanus TaxID=6706 RepID=A0A8J5K5A2_HOMAM|nr:EF-hand calcium-binding domain-containing protein 1-like isoform X3 [Homarus americanus]KAG7167853.1 EF-hand calcium-binding domain-containing protein 1-like [Homarus americanus]